MTSEADNEVEFWREKAEAAERNLLVRDKVNSLLRREIGRLKQDNMALLKIVKREPSKIERVVNYLTGGHHVR